MPVANRQQTFDVDVDIEPDLRLDSTEPAIEVASCELPRLPRLTDRDRDVGDDAVAGAAKEAVSGTSSARVSASNSAISIPARTAAMPGRRSPSSAASGRHWPTLRPTSQTAQRRTAASAVDWSTSVTGGSEGASPQPSTPLTSRTRTATFSTPSSRPEAITNGRNSGTFNG
jgi:hypothetical protein